MASTEAATVTVTGANGSTGATGNSGSNGAVGESGTNGGGASATTTTPADAINTATATGGDGGNGGTGGFATSFNGTGGTGGAGGSAGNASAAATANTGGAPASAFSTATGGTGGSGGVGGNSAGIFGGYGAAAANGGAAIASASATNQLAGGATNVNANAVGGNGGRGGDPGQPLTSHGSNGGDGGQATLGTVFGSVKGNGAATVTGAVTGGKGGPASVLGSNGGMGASESLTDAISAAGSANSTILLYQSVNAGNGGDAYGGAPGNGGTANSSLNRTMGVADLQVRTGAYGGCGGTQNFGGDAGLPGGAVASTTATNTSGMVTATTDAFGGNGGQGLIGSAGGSATASASAVGQTNADVRADASAHGGYGGPAETSIGGQPAFGGLGGTATVASVNGISTGGGSVTVFATQYGGNGGEHIWGTAGSAGNGAPSSITNAVSGSTSGSLSLYQEGSGGFGGTANGANAGNGGDGSSYLTASNPGGGLVYGDVFAYGGGGGNAIGSGVPGNGGNAVVNATITGSSNGLDASVLAQAIAGSGGRNSASGVSGVGGAATAVAHSIGKSKGYSTALAIATGRTASSTAIADSSGGIVTAMSVRTEAPAHPNVITAARCGFDTYFEADVAGLATTSAALPAAQSVADVLGATTKISAAYKPTDLQKIPLALAALALNPPGQEPTLSTMFKSSASYSFDVSTLTAGKLLLGLFRPTSAGGNFTSLHFSMTREGTTVEDQTFSTIAAANSFFNDRVIDLGALKSGVVGTLDLSFMLEMTGLDNGTGYGADLFIAGVSGLSGDFNSDGKVDSRDYLTWRKGVGTGRTQGELNAWRANFGRTAGSGAGLSESTAVPEPSTGFLLLAGLCCVASWRRSRFGLVAR